MRYEYPVELAPDPDGGFLVTFADVPEAITHGDTRAEALANAREALGLALRGYIVEGRPLPRPRRAGGRKVAPLAHDAVKLATIRAWRESGLTKTALAERMGKAENEARRILDPDHPTKLSTMQDALRLMGKEIVVDVQDAA